MTSARIGSRPAQARLATVAEILDDARAGRMFILVDHEDRENEGDLVIAAAFATAEAVNFMATHGRGLICLCLDGQRADALGLQPMAPQNDAPFATAFLKSIEARAGISTGISAFDRARTIQVASDPAFGPGDIVSPGHVFPLRARDGGVLVRAGHTEASVDISRLAGLSPAAVICEIIRDDGEMARLPDLMAFAVRHGLNIGSISDLIAYRQRHDGLVREVSRQSVQSIWGGDWVLHLFEDSQSGAQHVALSKGDLADDTAVLVRVHALDPFSDILGIQGGAGGTGVLAEAMERINQEGRGVLVLLSDSKAALPFRCETGEVALDDYGRGAQILAVLGLTRLRVLVQAPAPQMIGLDAYGLKIVSEELLKARAGKSAASKAGG